jgi:acylpyruvate hydrolase
MQAAAKAAGMPWSLSKGMDCFAPIGEILPADRVLDPHDLELWCTVNGEHRQRATTDHMIFKIPELLEYITRFITLEAGDIIMTGTPEGVGPIAPGDVIACGITGLTEASWKVSERRTESLA